MTNLLRFLATVRWLGTALTLAFGALTALCALNCFGFSAPMPLGAWLSFKSGIPCNPAMMGLMLFFALVSALLMLTALLAGDALSD